MTRILNRPAALAAALFALLALACLTSPGVRGDATAHAEAPPHADAPPVDKLTTRPLTAAELDPILADATAASSQARHVAQLRVKNLPAEAYELVRQRMDSDDLSPETQVTLQGALHVLKTRAHNQKVQQAHREFRKKNAVDAYERSKEHDPRWDGLARQALASLGEKYSLLASEEATYEKALFDRAIEAGCTDPVVVTFHTMWVCSARRPWQDGPQNAPYAKFGRAGPPAPPYGTEELRPLPIPEGTVERMRAACDAAHAGDYPALMRCLADLQAARVIFEAGGDRNEAAQRLKASLGELPAAMKEAAGDVDTRMYLATAQCDLESRTVPTGERQPVIDRILNVYKAADPDPTWPASFDGWALSEWGDQIRRESRGRLDPKSEEALQKITQASEDEMAAAAQATPTNATLVDSLLGAKVARQADPEEVRKCFDQAMEADPDNRRACLIMLKHLEEQENAAEAMIGFGRECLARENFRGRVSDLLIEIHTRLARGAGQDYFRRPDVWGDVRAVYDSLLTALPDSAPDRSIYARCAWMAGEYAVADAQFERLGERVEVPVFGNDRIADYLRLESARLARPAWRDPEPPAAVDHHLADALGQAAQAFAGQGGDLVPIVQSVAGKLPEVPAGDGPGHVTWKRITLNAAGRGFDGFRFRTPKGKPADLRWGYVYGPSSMTGWYCMPAHGEADHMFKNYQPISARDVPIPGPGDGGVHQAVIQVLAADRLKPDTEYVMYFGFSGSEPVRMSVGLTFVPPANQDPDYDTMLRDLGLKK